MKSFAIKGRAVRNALPASPWPSDEFGSTEMRISDSGTLVLRSPTIATKRSDPSASGSSAPAVRKPPPLTAASQDRLIRGDRGGQRPTIHLLVIHLWNSAFVPGARMAAPYNERVSRQS